jgi:DNA-directed RNA polymerase sigma subunit (sigma70/sigma32)
MNTTLDKENITQSFTEILSSLSEKEKKVIERRVGLL